MNITFLIGNGFDKRLGLNTSFTDMYKGYLAIPSAYGSAVEKFKDELRNAAPQRYKTWSDFEMAMADYAKNFSTENDFIECVRDFKSYMISCLKSEELRFKQRLEQSQATREACVAEMRKSLDTFYNGQIPNVINAINELEGIGGRSFWFIDFNYTRTLDYLYGSKSSRRNIFDTDPVHIHGSLDNESDIVLGVDRSSQIKATFFPISRRLERAFIKPRYNEMYDKSRIDKASEIIQRSDVICVYGMSFGLSDASWIDEVIDWLCKDEFRHLIYFDHQATQMQIQPWDEKMEIEDEKKETLLGRICPNRETIDEIINRVHIPVGFDIFDFDFCIEEAHRQECEKKAYETQQKELNAKRSTGSMA